MSGAPLTVRRWKRIEYERVVDLGVFDREPVELIGGQLLVAEPQNTYHAVAVGKSGDALRAALPQGWIVRVQMPIALDDESAPEPDVAVVRGSHDVYLASHPQQPALLIEVADLSLRFDRGEKGSLYARGGVLDYWIVNVVDRVIEVYRDPQPDSSAPSGWRYRSVETFAAPSIIVPLALPSSRIAVADLY